MTPRNYNQELIQSTKRPSDKMDTMSYVAIVAGFIALLAVVLYGGHVAAWLYEARHLIS